MSTHVRHPHVRATQRVISTQWRAGTPQHQRRSLNHTTAEPETQYVTHKVPVDRKTSRKLDVDYNWTARAQASPRLAVKDNIAAMGLPTTCDSTILAGNEIPFDATIVTQLRDRRFHVVSKTAMDEFGMGSHSTTAASKPVHNVGRFEDYSAGGSSGGSAVAIKQGAADLALGTDTGGSVRLPAAYTGTVGFKPSYGMLSRWGVVPYANSLDTVGLLAHTVAPIYRAIVESGLAATDDPKDPTSLPASVRMRCMLQRKGYKPFQRDTITVKTSPIRGMTFGIPLEYNIEELSPRVRRGWAEAIRKIEEKGGRVVSVSLPSTKNALSAYYVIAPAEAASNLSKYDGIRFGKRASDSTSDSLDGILYANTRGSGFGSEVKRRILLGSYTLSSEAMDNYFIQAQKVRQLVRRDFDRVFSLPNPLHDQRAFDLSEMDDAIKLEDKLGPAQVDFILCPTAPTTPPLLKDVMKQTPLDSYMNDVFTVPASLAGLPAISIPMDLPVDDPNNKEERLLNFGGLQIVGQYWDDARVLAVAEAISGFVSKSMKIRLEKAAASHNGKSGDAKRPNPRLVGKDGSLNRAIKIASAVNKKVW